MKSIKTIITNYKKMIILLAMFFICSSVYSLDIESSNGLLINMNDFSIIDEKNKDEVVSVASLTKIMTSIVAIENIKDFSEKITITKDMIKGLIEENAYVLWLRPGQKLTYKDILYATFITSAADATKALAISISGSEEEFVKLMNDKDFKIIFSSILNISQLVLIP